MDKNLLIFIAVGIVGIYFVTNFIGDIQKDDEKFQNTEYTKKQQYEQFNSKNSIGLDIIDTTGASADIQIEAWNKSKLKKQMIDYFPDFDTMKLFAKERTRGEVLVPKLLKQIDTVEGKFLAGTIDSEEAKRELRTLK